MLIYYNPPGLKGVMLRNAPGGADTPRAHITNMAALGAKPSPQLVSLKEVS